MWHSAIRNLLNSVDEVLNEIEYLGARDIDLCHGGTNPQMLQITDDTFQLRCEMTIPQVKTITSKTMIPQVKRQWQDLLQLWTWNGPWSWVWVVFLSIIGDVMTLAQGCLICLFNYRINYRMRKKLNLLLWRTLDNTHVEEGVSFKILIVIAFFSLLFLRPTLLRVQKGVLKL